MHAHRCFWVIIPNKVKTDAHQGYDIWVHLEYYTNKAGVNVDKT